MIIATRSNQVASRVAHGAAATAAKAALSALDAVATEQSRAINAANAEAGELRRKVEQASIAVHDAIKSRQEAIVQAEDALAKVGSVEQRCNEQCHELDSLRDENVVLRAKITESRTAAKAELARVEAQLTDEVRRSTDAQALFATQLQSVHAEVEQERR